MLANLSYFIWFIFKQVTLKRKYEEDLCEIIEKSVENAFSHHKHDIVSVLKLSGAKIAKIMDDLGLLTIEVSNLFSII